MKEKKVPWTSISIPHSPSKRGASGRRTAGAHKDADIEVINLSGSSEMEEDNAHEGRVNYGNRSELDDGDMNPNVDSVGNGGDGDNNQDNDNEADTDDIAEDQNNVSNSSSNEPILITCFEPVKSSSDEATENTQLIDTPSTSSMITRKRKVEMGANAAGTSQQSSSECANSRQKPKRTRKILSDNDEDMEAVQNLEDMNSCGSSESEIAPTPPKRIRRRKKKVRRLENSSSEDDEPSDRSDQTRTPPNSKISKGINKRSLRSSAEKKKSEKECALERLQNLMEKRLQKEANRPPPVRNVVESESSEKPSSSSEYEDPDFIVDDDDYENSRNNDRTYNASGSSSSSSTVTSSAETTDDDLESGSEGDQNLAPEPEQDIEEKSDRTSSSSEDEPPDDGQNDTRCILCKELGSKSFKDRSKHQTIDWCNCGECDVFADGLGDYDLVCCKEMKTVQEFIEDELDDDVCITKHSRFKIDTLQGGGYARAISNHCEYGTYRGGGAHGFYEYNFAKHKEREVLKNRALNTFKSASENRKYGFCLTSFKYWIFDCMRGDERQMLVPACVHKKIRERFHFDRTRSSIKFRPSFQCESQRGLHCKATFTNDDVDDNQDNYSEPEFRY